MLEKRRSERKQLKQPIKGKVRVYKFQQKHVSSNFALIDIENVSINGLRISTPLNFPVKKELILSLEFQLFGMEHHVLGTIAWKEKNKSTYTYGIELLSTDMGYIQSISSFFKPAYL